MKIQCSNCGKKIPYTGNVCPHCNNDKTKDKSNFDIIFGVVFGGIIILIMYYIN